VVVAANDAAPMQWRIPMPRLTDTQLVILSSALRRNDRGVDLPANVTGEAGLLVETLRVPEAEKIAVALANEFPRTEIGVYRLLCEITANGLP
jgi:hypothetical protein